MKTAGNRTDETRETISRAVAAWYDYGVPNTRGLIVTTIISAILTIKGFTTVANGDPPCRFIPRRGEGTRLTFLVGPGK